jgi:hypothetical protein
MLGLTGEQALLIGCLLLSIALTAWGAATLGNPATPYPQRPLPRPSKRWRRKHARSARQALHSREDAQEATQPLHWAPRATRGDWPAPERTGRRDLEEWVTDLFRD